MFKKEIRTVLVQYIYRIPEPKRNKNRAISNKLYLLKLARIIQIKARKILGFHRKPKPYELYNKYRENFEAPMTTAAIQQCNNGTCATGACATGACLNNQGS